jgi:hypothetical protein
MRHVMMRARTMLAAAWLLVLVLGPSPVSADESLELVGRKSAFYSPSDAVLAGGCMADVEVSFASSAGVPDRGYIDLEFACSHFDCSGAVLGGATERIEFSSPFNAAAEG